mmetsp:Transcript_9584/g.15407  ORF Transcript_9584/g.15407 Transcript_9584/m.15407 type:complete len:134 (+) Transcript_9584:1136-1537(+)
MQIEVLLKKIRIGISVGDWTRENDWSRFAITFWVIKTFQSTFLGVQKIDQRSTKTTQAHTQNHEFRPNHVPTKVSSLFSSLEQSKRGLCQVPCDHFLFQGIADGDRMVMRFQLRRPSTNLNPRILSLKQFLAG